MTPRTLDAPTVPADVAPRLAASLDEHIVPADVDPDDAVLAAWERHLVLVLWLLAAWLPALALWVVFGYFGFFYAPLLWLLTLGASAPAMGSVLGHIGAIEALPPESRPLLHLPPVLAGLVREAAAIRRELHRHGLEPALERAWILTCEFNNLPAEQRAGLDRSRDALTGIRALIDLRADGRARVTDSFHSARLDAALTDFETSLAEPGCLGFR